MVARSGNGSRSYLSVEHPLDSARARPSADDARGYIGEPRAMRSGELRGAPLGWRAYLVAFSGAMGSACVRIPQLTFVDEVPIEISAERPPEPRPVVAFDEPTSPRRVEVAAEKHRIDLVLHYADGQVEPNRDDLRALDTLIAFLLSHDEIELVAIDGHRSAAGDPPNAEQVGLRRAQSVQQYLVDAGIHEERLLVRAWGSNDPVADDATLEGQLANRRVEFAVLQQSETTRAIYVDPATGVEVPAPIQLNELGVPTPGGDAGNPSAEDPDDPDTKNNVANDEGA